MNDKIRYQLLHRTASAIITARDFHASTAVMVVHSFSPEGKWRGDFIAFCDAMNAKRLSDDVYIVTTFANPKLYLVWCAGDKKFLDVELPRVI
jgi:hypothetical protein